MCNDSKSLFPRDANGVLHVVALSGGHDSTALALRRETVFLTLMWATQAFVVVMAILKPEGLL